jgi:hypothetical protein
MSVEGVNFGFYEVGYDYFPTDRLVGIFQADIEDEPCYMVELVHLTSRFGAFERRDSKWHPIAPNWNIDRGLTYINIKNENYDEIVELFDKSWLLGDKEPPEKLEYDEVKICRKWMNWEMEFALLSKYRKMLSINQLVNQVQFFVEPRPAVFKPWNTWRRIDEAGEAAFHINHLEESRTEAEQSILRKSHLSYLDQKDDLLTKIQMFPPLHQAVMEMYWDAGRQASLRDSLEDFESDLDFSSFSNYMNGGAVSIETMLKFYLQHIRNFADFFYPMSKNSIDEMKMWRPAHMKPEDRLEIWVLLDGQGRHLSLVANTRFGTYIRRGLGKWRHRKDDPEREDMFDLAGVEVLHIRPEKNREALKLFDSEEINSLSKSSMKLRPYLVYYTQDEHQNDYSSRIVNYETNFDRLSELEKLVVMEMITEYRNYDKYLNSIGISRSEYASLSIDDLDEFLTQGKPAKYWILKLWLGDLFSDSDDGASSIEFLYEYERRKYEKF